MKKYVIATLMVLIPCLQGPRLAWGVSKEIQYIMQQLDTLQQMVQSLQKNIDAQTQDLRNLINQTNKNVAAMKSTVTDLQKATEQTLAGNNARFDTMAGQLQALSESLEEAKSRLSKLSEQAKQTQNIIETLNVPPAAGPKPPGTNPVPDADSLYKSALSYYNGGQFQLAIQGFQEYLKYFGDTDLASNAQYYIGECYYSLENYTQAVEEFNKCLERYPAGNKQPAAQLKKGFALLKLKQTQAGIRELRSVAQRYPNSQEASLARQRLKQLGVTLSGRRGE